jgi:sec-independent protein translocase protein TatC
MTVAEESSPAAGEMTLFEHLAELRSRIVRVLIALVIGAAVGFALFDPLLAFLTAPYCDLPRAFRGGPEGECVLVAGRALEPFSVRMKVSLLFGAFVGGPVIFYQLYRFIAPGLTSREKRYAVPFVVGSQLLFAAGIGFAFLIIPRGLAILLDFGGEGIQPLLSANEYVSFLTLTALAFGLVFELPLVLILLSLLGMVTSGGLRRFRPYALVLNTILAAVVTPTTDAITLLFMAGPMAVFYEASIIAAWLIERSRRKRP